MITVVNLLTFNTRSVFLSKKRVAPSYSSLLPPFIIYLTKLRNHFTNEKEVLFEGSNVSYSRFSIVVSVLKHMVQYRKYSLGRFPLRKG